MTSDKVVPVVEAATRERPRTFMYPLASCLAPAIWLRSTRKRFGGSVRCALNGSQSIDLRPCAPRVYFR